MVVSQRRRVVAVVVQGVADVVLRRRHSVSHGEHGENGQKYLDIGPIDLFNAERTKTALPQAVTSYYFKYTTPQAPGRLSGSEEKRQPTNPQVVGSNPNGGIRILTEAYCEQGAV